MTLILANLPKQYQDAAKSYIQQTIRNNVSGELSKSWCKIKIRQFSANIRNKKLPLMVTINVVKPVWLEQCANQCIGWSDFIHIFVLIGLDLSFGE